MFRKKIKRKRSFPVKTVLIILVVIVLGAAGYSAMPERITDAYVKANAPDLVELKNGKRLVGKIIGETHKSYYIKTLSGEEEKVDRDTVNIARRPSKEELDIARLILTKKTGGLIGQITTACRKICHSVNSRFDEMKNSVAVDEKYKAEVAAAKRARGNLENKIAEDEAKEEAAKRAKEKAKEEAAKESEGGSKGGSKAGTGNILDGTL